MILEPIHFHRHPFQRAYAPGLVEIVWKGYIVFRRGADPIPESAALAFIPGLRADFARMKIEIISDRNNVIEPRADETDGPTERLFYFVTDRQEPSKPLPVAAPVGATNRQHTNGHQPHANGQQAKPPAQPMAQKMTAADVSHLEIIVATMGKLANIANQAKGQLEKKFGHIFGKPRQVAAAAVSRNLGQNIVIDA